MTDASAPDDETLWRRFHACDLAEPEWTHVAHLRTAWMFLRRYEKLDEAHLLIRVGIIRLNASQGLVETAERGYHDTMTRVWLVLVRSAMRETPHFLDSSSFLAAHADRFPKAAPLAHYSRERLLSIEARARFVDPDLLPLPI